MSHLPENWHVASLFNILSCFLFYKEYYFYMKCILALGKALAY